jgi:hypothetical protein
VVPLPVLIRHGRVPDVIHRPQPAREVIPDLSPQTSLLTTTTRRRQDGGAQVRQHERGDARLADQAHGGDGAGEALEDGARPARVGGQVDVHGRDEGGGGPGDVGGGDEAAEGDCVWG